VIVVTSGSMLPFDRLIRAMDEWAGRHPEEEVFAQIGKGSYEPKNMRWARLLGRKEFSELVSRARFIVGHAGIGTFVMAQEMGKPLLLLPRRLDLKEHTSDHQLHTAKWLAGKPGIHIAMTGEELLLQADQLMTQDLKTECFLDSRAPDSFIARIREFLTKP
jgi:UDP-N-acetylglucosamine transferase subunit ALG13